MCKLDIFVGHVESFFRQNSCCVGEKLQVISRSEQYLKMRPVQSDISMFTALSFRLISMN